MITTDFNNIWLVKNLLQTIKWQEYYIGREPIADPKHIQ